MNKTPAQAAFDRYEDGLDNISDVSDWDVFAAGWNAAIEHREDRKSRGDRGSAARFFSSVLLFFGAYGLLMIGGVLFFSAEPVRLPITLVAVFSAMLIAAWPLHRKASRLEAIGRAAFDRKWHS